MEQDLAEKEPLRIAIESLLDGDAVLFAGAGFSIGAGNVNGKPLPTGPDFAKILRDRIKVLEDLNLEESAEAFMDELGPDALIGELHRWFRVRTTADYHRHLSSLPWRRIYTTNYDNVIERAASEAGVSVSPVTLDDDIYQTSSESVRCIHLNGYVDRITRENILSNIKLTETSYISASIAESPWAMLFRQDIRLARAVFFVGYSLADLDLKRILASDESLRAKSFFIVGSAPGDRLARKVAKFGQLVTMTGEEFSQCIRDIRSDYSPRESGSSLLAVHEYHPSEPSSITDQDFIDLFLKGRIASEKIEESIRTNRPFYLQRSKVKEVLNLVDEHPVVVVQGHLGNGKTLLLEGLKYAATEAGYRVFYPTDQSSTVSAELEKIGQLPDKTLIVIDDYQRWLSEIRHYRSTCTDRSRLVLTARTAVHDVVLDDLLDAAGLSYVMEVPIDTLNDQDLKWMIEVLDLHGLWGDHASGTHTRKYNFLRDRCRSQFHAILLRLLASPEIGERLRVLWASVGSNLAQQQVVLSVFILTIIGVTPTVSMLSDLWDLRVIGNSQVRRNEGLRELIDFDNQEVLLRSPAAAEFLLQTTSDPATIIGVLSHMMKRAHDGAKVIPAYRGLFKELMLFRNVQMVLPQAGAEGAVIRYYESIKNLSRCRENPLFWFQYAIACLMIKDIDRSDRYFKTAYSFADASDFDTFQIDNHYARFLLVLAVERYNVKEAMVAFRSARQIINRQVSSEELHYPYRVAKEYQGFLDRFASELTLQNIQEVSEAAYYVLGRIDDLPADRRRHKAVRECEQSMIYVLDRTDDLKKNL